MELDSEGWARLVTESADRISVALRRHAVALGRLLDVVAVTHPSCNRLLRRETGEQALRLQNLHLGAPVLTAIGADHLSAFDVRNELHSVADAEHRGDVEDGRIA